MQTKQKAELLFCSPLWLISNGIRYSHDNHDKSDTKVINVCPNCRQNVDIEYLDQEYKCHSCGETFSKQLNIKVIGEKDFDLIKRIGFHMSHSSVLECSLIVYHLELTQKALLEASRHRIGVSMTVTSSRYALDSMGIEFEPSGDDEVDDVLEKLKEEIQFLVNLSGKKRFDKLAELLPQAFIYKGQFTFNLRSLVHFLKLRTAKSAHRDIRLLSYMMFKELPKDYQELILSDEQISKQITQCEKDFETKNEGDKNDN